MPHKKRALWALAAASGFAAAAEPPATPLAEITSTATRTERRVDEVPATVSVQKADEIEAAGARDIKDLFRNAVDLSVRASQTRFGAASGTLGRAGNEGLNIRGLEGNQVLLLVDGVRMPGSFTFGAFATGRGDYLALDNAQAVEVLRGPASTQFGSDGLAGALSLRTLEPGDLLQPGAPLGGFVRLGGSSLDDSAAVAAALAARQGDWAGLLLLSQRQGHETENQGSHDTLDSNRTTPNPQSWRQQSLLGKLQYRLSAAHRLGFTVEAVRRKVDTEVYTGRAVQPTTTSTAVIDLDAHDELRRDRVSLEHRYEDLNAPLLQQAETRVYVQDSRTTQFTAEDRLTAADRTRDNLYREKLAGFSTLLQGSFGGAVAQRLSVGLDASRNEISALRDGTVPPFGETFPVKPFPDTKYTLAGAFAQSEIEAGSFTVIPALRYDHYKLQPDAAGFVGSSVSTLSDHAFTPRLGAVWRLAKAFAPYAQWAEGFRAPTPDQVNNGFTNAASFYESIGNPDLKPEHARSFEVGARGKLDGFSWQLAAYDNRYKDFISQEVIRGSGTSFADRLIFQYINLAGARIRGVELRGEWKIDRAWALTAATAATRGTRSTNGVEEPLDSVDPARTALGLRYTQGAFEWRADVLHAQAKARSRIRSSTPPAFAPGSYTVLDLALRWRVQQSWTLTAQLNNVTDETYWRWSDVRGVADTSTVKDAFTAPGRHVQLALRHDF